MQYCRQQQTADFVMILEILWSKTLTKRFFVMKLILLIINSKLAQYCRQQQTADFVLIFTFTLCSNPIRNHNKSAVCYCLQHWTSFELIINKINILLRLLSNDIISKIITKSAVYCCLQHWTNFELIMNKISFHSKKSVLLRFNDTISKIITKSAVCCCLQFLL